MPYDCRFKEMKKLTLAFLCLYLFMTGLLCSALAQNATHSKTKKATMTNAQVSKLVKRRLTDAAIIESIRQSIPRFDISAKGLKQLRKAHVGEAVISEIVDAQRAAVPSSAAQGGHPCNPAPSGTMTGGYRSGIDKRPPSQFYKFITLDEASTFRLPPVLDAGRERLSPTKQMRIGVVRPLTPPIDPLVKGKCFDLGPDGVDQIIAIVSEGARQLRVRFASVDMPPKAKLFVYSMQNQNEIHGPYEGHGIAGQASFWTPPMEGDGVVIEYYQPRAAVKSQRKRGDFLIIELSHIYGSSNAHE